MDYKTSLNSAERERIKNCRVCIVGCGGTGGYVAEHLIRLGVGQLVAVDGDCFHASNLNRQLYCTSDSLGTGKAAAVKNRAFLINPDVNVVAVDEYLTADNAARILQGCDLAIDALDSFEARELLQNACCELGIPLLFGGIGPWKVQIGLFRAKNSVFSDVYAPEHHGESVLPFVPAMCAALQVSEAVKLLCGERSDVENTILDIDLLTNEIIRIEI